MKNLFRYVLAALVITFAFGITASSARAQGGPETVRLLYQKMDANFKSLTSLKTGIRLEKWNSQLKDYDDRREGTALVVPIKNTRNANFRLDWAKPAEETLSVVNGKYRLYQPRLQQVIEGSSKDYKGGGGSSGNIFSLINSSAKDLKENFDAKPLGTEVVANVHSTYKLLLTPKKPMNFDHAEVWVNEEGMVVQIRVYEKNSDWTNVLLFDIQKNASISGKDIAGNIPKNIKIIKG